MQQAGRIAHARTMASYNLWMNERLYEACAQLPDDKRKRDAGAFFGSIHGTLNHLLVADRIWMARFTAQSFAFKSLREELYADFDELRAARAHEDQRIIDWVESLQEADFDTDLRYTSFVNPKPRQYPLWFAVMHFFNHQTHHRGQITTLLSQQHLDPGVTDLILLPELQPVE